MKRMALSAALLMAAAVGCDQKPKEEPTPVTPVVETPPVAETQPASVNAEQAALDQVPVAEDFEEQATRQITAENLDAELEKLEKEVTD